MFEVLAEALFWTLIGTLIGGCAAKTEQNWQWKVGWIVGIGVYFLILILRSCFLPLR
jgi:hypothetical protein